MSTLVRRDLLAALMALAALPATAQAAATPDAFDGLDRAAVARIGKAWLATHPGTSAAQVRRRLFPSGRGEQALPGLRRQAAADFRRGAVFVHRGWRLSDTEGALFGLLALEAG